MAKEKTELTDIFDGEYVSIWRDEDIIFFATPFVTLNFSEEEWEVFKKDMKKLGDL